MIGKKKNVLRFSVLRFSMLRFFSSDSHPPTPHKELRSKKRHNVIITLGGNSKKKYPRHRVKILF